MNRRRVALYGGSFNPPHIAHVLTVAYGLSACPVDEVWVVPVGNHAFGKQLAPFEDRAEMCRRAFALFGDRVRLSAVEQELGGVNRTIDTVRHLTGKHPDTDFALLMGTDLFEQRERWKQWDVLEKMVDMHVVGRTGVPDPPGVAVGPPLPPVSSTEIRRRLAAGESLAGWVPLAVEAYARERGLYSATT